MLLRSYYNKAVLTVYITELHENTAGCLDIKKLQVFTGRSTD
jgi:hypothetical protein